MARDEPVFPFKETQGSTPPQLPLVSRSVCWWNSWFRMFFIKDCRSSWSCHPARPAPPKPSLLWKVRVDLVTFLSPSREVALPGSGSGEATTKVRGTAWEEGQKRSDRGYPLRPNTHVGTIGFWASSTTVVLSWHLTVSWDLSRKSSFATSFD